MSRRGRIPAFVSARQEPRLSAINRRVDWPAEPRHTGGMTTSRAAFGFMAAMGLLCGIAEVRPAIAKSATQTVPSRLVDVSGASVDVASLASDHRLFFVTLKATWCPVCQVQLRRLQADLARLRSCDATFVVLAPGPRATLLRIAEQTSFPYPFVEDVDLAIATAAGLRLAPDQIEPAIFEVNPLGEIVWMERGRSAGRFNDQALLKRLECDALHTAQFGVRRAAAL